MDQLPQQESRVEVTTTETKRRITFDPTFLYTNLDWGSWIYGILSGFISGGATAVTGGIVVGSMDSKEFNFGGFKSVKLMLAIFVVSGLLNCFNYLKSHPLPELEKRDKV